MLFRFFSTCLSLLLSWSLRHDFAFRAVSASRRRCLRVRHSRSASAELTPPVQCEPSVSPRSRLSSARTLTCCESPEPPWPPYPRHGRGFRRAACGPLFVRRRECLVAGASSSKVCIANGDLCTFHQALLCSVSRDRALVCSGSSCSASVPGLQSHRSSVFATLRSCRRCAWLCASWSVGTSRRRHACIDGPVSMSGGANFVHPLRGPVTTSHRFPSRVIPHGPGHDVPS